MGILYISGGLEEESGVVDGEEFSRLVGGVYWFVGGMIAGVSGLAACIKWHVICFAGE